MFSLKLDNVFLDIDQQACTVEKNSPLFMTDQELIEWSTPLTVKYSEKNFMALQQYFHELTEKQQLTLFVDIYEGPGNRLSYVERAAFIIDGAVTDWNHKDGSSVTGLLFTGLSEFFNVIKNKKLSALELGGLKNIGSDFDAWQTYIRNTWSNTDDFIVAPVRDDNWYGDPDAGTGWMNEVYTDPSDNTQLLPGVYLDCPFLRLKFVLENIFSEHGWILDTTGLNDTHWENLFVMNAKPIPFTLKPGFSGITYELEPFKLSMFLPAEKTISEFFRAICNRYGWVPLISANNRICKMVALKEVKNGTKKDWTAYASPRATAEFKSKKKIFSFKNEFTGADDYPEDPSFDGYKKGNTYDSIEDFPDQSTGLYDTTVVFSHRENAWYKVELDEVTNDRVWALHSDNIYNEEEADETDTYETQCTTLPSVTSLLRTVGGIEYYARVPYWNQSQFEETGIRTVFYLGLVKEKKADGTDGLADYPYCSAVSMLPDGTVAGDWSNVYKRVSKTGVDDGIIEYWFSDFTKMIEGPEVKDRYIELPKHELLNFSWTDQIFIRNIPHLVKNLTITRPYNGTIQAKLQRINLSKISLGEPAPVTIYVKLVLEDIQVEPADFFAPFPTFKAGSRSVLLHFYCFSDAAGTIPYIPPAGFMVQLRITFVSGASAPYITDQAQGFSVFDFGTMSNDQVDNVSYRVALDGEDITSTAFNYTYELLPAAGYTIIP